MRGEVGELVCRKPFPGMTRGFWRDPDRYLDAYWRRLPGIWVHGDWASVDEDGYWFLHGRSDDTMNIAGKRIGPAELESAAVEHEAVLEAAAVGIPHPVKGEVAWIFCVAGARFRAVARAGGGGVWGSRRRARQGVPPGPCPVRSGPTEDAQCQDRAPRGQGAGARRRSRRPVVGRESGKHSTRSAAPSRAGKPGSAPNDAA